MSVALRRPRQRDQSAAVALPLVIGSLRFNLTVEPSHRPVVPMSVRLCGHLWGGGCRPRGRRTGAALDEAALMKLDGLGLPGRCCAGMASVRGTCPQQ
jgi:hypothetical protein